MTYEAIQRFSLWRDIVKAKCRIDDERNPAIKYRNWRDARPYEMINRGKELAKELGKKSFISRLLGR
jgi:hypothetical protein